MNRIIMHLDLDCFFASVEMRDNPKLEKKPVIIGADPKNGYGRGVVSTCNYKAREFGLHSAMPISKAYSLCPHGVYLRPSHEKYSAASRKVMQIINSYSESFQQTGIDEAYLEVTDICEDYTEARDLAKGIQNHIRESIGVTLSIGIAPTKSIAKIASDHKKPRGITVVKPEYIHQFLYNMKITRIPGIGKKSKIHYLNKGFQKIGDFIDCPKHKLISLFGKHGKWIYKVINGLDQREVKEFNHFRKSISKERTFYEDTSDLTKIVAKLEDINERIHKKLEKNQVSYKTITLKIRFEGFETYTRSRTLSFPIRNKRMVMDIILDLLEEFRENNKKVRLIGIKLSNLKRNTKTKQTNLFSYIQLHNTELSQ